MFLKKSLLGIKNVISTNTVQQYISFVSVVRVQLGTNVGAKCFVRLTTQRPNNLLYNRMFEKCCILYLKSRARLTGKPLPVTDQVILKRGRPKKMIEEG